MEFFKKRGTAWAVFVLVVVCSFFIGQARQPADHIEILPSGVYVQDNADVLSADTENYMTELNNGLVSLVRAEIQVVTINTVGGQDIFDVAMDHGMNTNLSSNSCVFLIAVDDMDAVIVQGESLLYAFPDDELSDLLRSNIDVSDFKSRNLDRPVKDSFDDLISMYESYYDINVTGSQNIEYQVSYGSGMSGNTMIIILFVLFILFLVWMVSRPRRRRTVVTPVGGMGRTYVPPRTVVHTHTTHRNNSPPRGNNTFGSSRTGGFGSSNRGGSFSSGSRGGSFSSSSRPSSFGGPSRSGGFGSSSRGGSFRSGGASRSGGFGSSSRGGSFRSGGGSRGGGFRK